jgi:hypothetical protein
MSLNVYLLELLARQRLEDARAVAADAVRAASLGRGGTRRALGSALIRLGRRLVAGEPHARAPRTRAASAR